MSTRKDYNLITFQLRVYHNCGKLSNGSGHKNEKMERITNVIGQDTKKHAVKTHSVPISLQPIINPDTW